MLLNVSASDILHALLLSYAQRRSFLHLRWLLARPRLHQHPHLRRRPCTARARLLQFTGLHTAHTALPAVSSLDTLVLGCTRRTGVMLQHDPSNVLPARSPSAAWPSRALSPVPPRRAVPLPPSPSPPPSYPPTYPTVPPSPRPPQPPATTDLGEHWLGSNHGSLVACMAACTLDPRYKRSDFKAVSLCERL